MGSGIVIMHYGGMSAIPVVPAISYDPALAAVSVVIAVSASFVALWLTFTLRGQTYPTWAPRLTEVIDAVHPTALIGLSTASGAFTEQAVRHMAAHASLPIIMPLSNPTSRSEARPQDLADWTQGRALVATGSPFSPMRVGDASIPVAQCNNIYIFPGVGLAVTAVRATRVTDAMMTAAAAAVGDAATIRHDPHGTLLPDRAQLAGTATAVARAVAKAAVADAVAPALTDDQIDQAIDRTRWLPRYQSDHRVVSR